MESGASELGDAGLERNSRPRRRLLEDQPDRAIREDGGGPAGGAVGLELVREVEDLLELVSRPAAKRSEIAAFQALRHSRILLSSYLDNQALRFYTAKAVITRKEGGSR